MSEATGCSVPREFLPYELDYIPEFLKERAKTELSEDENTRIQGLNQLRSMLKDEPGLHWQDDDLFLLSFLRARKFDVKRAFQLVKNFYTVMGKYDELFHNFNFADVKRVFPENLYGILPYRDSDGSIIVVTFCSRWNPQASTVKDYMRLISVACLHAALSPATQIAGFKVIVDFSNVPLRFLSHLSPTFFWFIVDGLQNSFPGRFKAFHIVNEEYIFSYSWNIMKYLLSKKLNERFHLHGKKVKKLHQYFSPRILTAELGGELPPFDCSTWAKMLEEKTDYFEYVFSHGYEKYRLKSQEKYSKKN